MILSLALRQFDICFTKGFHVNINMEGKKEMGFLRKIEKKEKKTSLGEKDTRQRSYQVDGRMQTGEYKY